MVISYLGVLGLIHFEQWLFRALVLDCGWWCYYSQEYYTAMLLGESCTVILSGDFLEGTMVFTSLLLSLEITTRKLNVVNKLFGSVFTLLVVIVAKNCIRIQRTIVRPPFSSIYPLLKHVVHFSDQVEIWFLIPH